MPLPRPLSPGKATSASPQQNPTTSASIQQNPATFPQQNPTFPITPQQSPHYPITPPKPHSNSPQSFPAHSVRLRDHMDEILEPRGFFRKHVAHDGRALCRAVADVICHTQQHMHQVISTVFRGRLSETSVMDEILDLDLDHAEVRAMAKLFNIQFNVIETSDPSIQILVIKPDDYLSTKKEPLVASSYCRKNLRSRHSDQGSCLKSRRILLCCSSAQQYDPVYPKITIDNAAVAQSILYELLYSKVFGLTDAVEASEKMLAGVYDSYGRKPDVYDKEFQGTAMEALENFLIPFPYKVAKALDSKTYRNLEYDVWTNEQRGGSNTSSPAKSKSPYSSPGLRKNNASAPTIGTLSRGTPCLVIVPILGEVYGQIVQPTRDRKKMEVFLPEYGQTVFIPRKDVLPVKEAELQFEIPGTIVGQAGAEMYQGVEANEYFYEEGANAMQTMVQSVGEWDNNVLSHNVQLMTSKDPDWITKSDFSIPPPVVNYTNSQISECEPSALPSPLYIQSDLTSPQFNLPSPSPLFPMLPTTSLCQYLSMGGAPTTPLPLPLSPSPPYLFLQVDANGNYMHQPNPTFVFNYSSQFGPQVGDSPMGTPYPTTTETQVFQFPQVPEQ